ncbi:MAG: hypothetical protein QW331_03815 [Candidatus Woesearchaeota archaeon]
MAIVSLRELIDVVIMTLGVGFIFSDIFVPGYLHQRNKFGINVEGLKFAIIVTAPAVIFHELAHKIFGLIYGMVATFHAAYTWLAVGILLKLANFPFIFFVPGYVEITGIGTPLQMSIVAFAGPGLNLALWLGSGWALKNNKVSHKHLRAAILTREINKFLFILNMLPLPLFDGWKVYSGIWQTLF